VCVCVCVCMNMSEWVNELVSGLWSGVEWSDRQLCLLLCD
jgi:hypothetical protein